MMIKKLYIAVLFFSTAQALGKISRVIDRPYSDRNLYTLASRLPQRMYLRPNKPFQMTFFDFFKNQKSHIAALSSEEKKQYYGLLQDLYTQRGIIFFENQEKIATFAQTMGLGDSHLIYFHGPVMVETHKTFVELNGADFDKQFSKLSTEERAEYLKLKTALESAEKNENNHPSYKTHKAVVFAEMELQEYMLKMKLAYYANRTSY